MPYESKNGIAEIYQSEDNKDDNEVNLWGKPENRNLDIKDINAKIGDLEDYLKPGDISGIREILENKNEFDPGHSHLFLPRDKTVIFSHLNLWTAGPPEALERKL